MSKMIKKGSGGGRGIPPTHTQFKPGQSGNPKGRPKKKPSTFESEVKSVLNAKVKVKKDGKEVEISKRELLLERIVNGAIQGNPTLARLALPLLKVADDIPEFEVLPEDEAALKDLLKRFDEVGRQS